MNCFNGRKPILEYPCQWQYRLIGEDRAAIMEAIHAAVDVDLCVVSEGNTSSGGRYLSLNLEMTVNNEGERLHLYHLFSSHPAIRVVL
jgi:putative lipoic acid-binding regulatory protein